jgi:hypothetical protein
MFILARIKSAPEVGRGLLESGCRNLIIIAYRHPDPDRHGDAISIQQAAF